MKKILYILTVLACFLPLVAKAGETANSPGWGLVKVSVACMRAEPGHSSELVSQAVMGTPMRLLEKQGSWWLAESPEGYRGYVISNAVTEKSEEAMKQWRSASRAVVSAVNPGHLYMTDKRTEVRDVVSDLIYCGIVELVDTTGVKWLVGLPDGRRGYASPADFMPLEQYAAQTPDMSRLVDTALGFMGMPYLWGGTSSRGMDCSGMVKVCYLGEGLVLERDASEQALYGAEIDPATQSLAAGDLVFFGNPETGSINHVGIYDRDSCYVHCAGRVMRNSLDPESKVYAPDNNFVKAVRVRGAEGTEGIVPVGSHEWYFENKRK